MFGRFEHFYRTKNGHLGVNGNHGDRHKLYPGSYAKTLSNSLSARTHARTHTHKFGIVERVYDIKGPAV